MQTGCSISFHRQVEKSGTFAHLMLERLITQLSCCTMRCCVRLQLPALWYRELMHTTRLLYTAALSPAAV